MAEKNNNAQYKANRNYRAKHYDRIEVVIPAGTKEQLKEFARSAGAKSLQQWLMGLIEKETGLELALRNDLPWLSPTQKSEEEENGAD